MIEKKFKHWKVRQVTLILGIFLHFSFISVYAQSICSESNPNHYILLIDASASMVYNLKKAQVYKEILTDKLMERLYKSGFSESIPPLDPGKDFLTLLYFGAGSGDIAPIQSQIKNLNFPNEYIHQGLIRQQGIFMEDLKEYIWPEKFYPFTFSSLSAPMALLYLSSTYSLQQINRTFLIKVHDKLDDVLPYDEMTLLRNWGDREKIEKIAESMRSINENYILTDGKGKAGRALCEQVGGETSPILIDGYEIISLAQKVWEDNLARLGSNPYSAIKAINEESSKEKNGIIEITLNKSFADLFKEKKTTALIEIDDGKKTTSRQTDFEPILKIPVEFPSSLFGKTITYKITVKIKYVQSDKLLGERIIIYQCIQEDIIIPIPSLFRFQYLVYLLIIVVLIFIIQKFLNTVTGIKIEIPGCPRTPVSIKFGHENRFTAPIKPVLGFQAFFVKLPDIKIIRKIINLFLKGGEIRFQSEQEPDSYWGMNIYPQLKTIQIPSRETRFDIWWKSIPRESTTISITLVKGEKKGSIIIDFSPGVRIESRGVGLKRINTVAFDMGSESIAAYCKLHGDFEGKNIDLQEFASEFIGDNGDIDYFMTLKNGQPIRSHRLHNLISLENRRQPFPLPPDHARLDFIDSNGDVIATMGNRNYDLSLFEFFYKKGAALARKVIPNPKVLYQEGVRKIIPEIEADAIGFPKVRHEPEILIHHLLTQILRNFVLNSTVMKNRKTVDNQGNKIEDHLILTLPNIYSITHAATIKNFVKENTDFDEVDIIYESDAAAYYIFDKIRGNDKFKEFIYSLGSKRKHESFQVLTLDIGHGTTDLGIIEIFYSARAIGDDPRRKFVVKARTGKCDGGNRLNYLFAQYYNHCLEEIYKKAEFRDLPMPPFNFINEPGGIIQGRVLEILEKFIIEVKKSITADYKIQFKEEHQETYIKDIFDRWIKTTKSLEDKINADEQLKMNLEREFQHLFTIEKLPGKLGSFLCKHLKWLVQPKTMNLYRLRRAISEYVETNGVDLLNYLGEIAYSREARVSRYKKGFRPLKEIILERPTFVIIAGQASQFMPLKAAIETSLNIPQSNIVFLQGDEAKEACVKGAVTYKELSFQQLNVTEIHGTFGFMNIIRDPFDNFRLLDMRALNNGKKVLVEFSAPSTYWLFYSPLAPHTVTNIRPPELFNGTTALIQGFPNERIFEVEYDMVKLEIVVNGRATFRIATYGDVNESIYPKLWPVVLNPNFESKASEGQAF